MDQHSHWLGSGFLESARRFPDRPAVEVDGQQLSYAELHARAVAVAAALEGAANGEGERLTAVFAARSETAFVGVLAALFRGHGYVPLNPSYPAERTGFMLERSGCEALIVDARGEEMLPEVLKGVSRKLVLVFPDAAETGRLRDRFPGHTVLGAGDLAPCGELPPASVREDDVAYLLFTSGSTGHPKGVMVCHRNIHHFLEVMSERYRLNEHDRLSQMFDMVFDLSVFDLFMAWKAGACVCCPRSEQVLLPGEYIRSAALTVWFSVPSVAVLMMRLRQLEPGAFPSLRLSLFCGEALPADAADAWAKAAPGGALENLYGPTELTLACTLYRWKGDESLAECENGYVPIGHPYPGMSALVVNEQLNPVEPGECGELIMTGPQVALGYWKDAEKTRQAFVRLVDEGEVYYRTGDLVREDPESKELHYVGRIDSQVKIHGNRVELGEIEAVLKKASGASRVVVVGWPVNENGVGGVVGFLEGETPDKERVIGIARESLPGYMVPSRLVDISKFPLNANGKIDRKVLIASLEGG